jgi:hypothetical protein
MNTKVTKTMLEYIRNLKPGKAPQELTAGYLTAKQIASSSSAGDKRKRDDVMDVDSSSDDKAGQAQKALRQQQQLAKKSPPTTSATPSTSIAISESIYAPDASEDDEDHTFTATSSHPMPARTMTTTTTILLQPTLYHPQRSKCISIRFTPSFITCSVVYASTENCKRS